MKLRTLDKLQKQSKDSPTWAANNINSNVRESLGNIKASNPTLGDSSGKHFEMKNSSIGSGMIGNSASFLIGGQMEN